MEKVMASHHPDDRRLLAMIVPSTVAKAVVNAKTYEESKEKDTRLQVENQPDSVD